MKKMDLLSTKLEVTFGPDTADLTLRIGMHSGPVTGGFLKGKQSRFQLFGDTITTASLLQETGESNRIHISEETAELLIKAGKHKWVEKRAEKVHTEEKGELQTYWLNRGRRHGQTEFETTSNGVSAQSDEIDELYGLDSEHRWVEWNTEVLRNLLKQIVARRENQRRLSGDSHHSGSNVHAAIPLEEVKEIIELPKFDRKAAKRQRDNQDVEIPQKVSDQLKSYVTQIAGLYAQNVGIVSATHSTCLHFVIGLSCTQFVFGCFCTS